MNYFLVLVFANGILFSFIALVVLERLFLSRLSNLHHDVSAVRQSGNLSQKVRVIGNDEIAELARTINALVDELNQMQRSLKQSLKFKSDTLANISHDARSPLSTIHLRAEMLQQGVKGPLNEQQKESVESILAGAQQLLFFVNNLLDASRLEAGSTTLNCRDFSLTSLVEEMTTSIRPQAQHKGLDFQTTVDEDVPATLYGDPERLAQVLSNLVGNAIKFTDQGRISVAFRHTAQKRLRIEVADTGQGIPPEEQAHVFEAFYQVEPSMTRRNMQGVGLGLTIVKELIDLMGGVATVQSEPGVGSTFIIEIPLTQSRKG